MGIQWVIAWGVALVFLVGAAVGIPFLFRGSVEEPKRAKECQTFSANVFDPYGIVIVGDISLCGYDLEWTNVEGPYDGLPPLKGIDKPKDSV